MIKDKIIDDDKVITNKNTKIKGGWWKDQINTKVVLQTTYDGGIDVHKGSVIHTCVSPLKACNSIYCTHLIHFKQNLTSIKPT